MNKFYVYKVLHDCKYVDKAQFINDFNFTIEALELMENTSFEIVYLIDFLVNSLNKYCTCNHVPVSIVLFNHEDLVKKNKVNLNIFKLDAIMEQLIGWFVNVEYAINFILCLVNYVNKDIKDFRCEVNIPHRLIKKEVQIILKMPGGENDET